MKQNRTLCQNAEISTFLVKAYINLFYTVRKIHDFIISRAINKIRKNTTLSEQFSNTIEKA